MTEGGGGSKIRKTALRNIRPVPYYVLKHEVIYYYTIIITAQKN